MINEIKVCECCGQPIREYKVTITKMMVRTLVKFRMAVIEKGENRVHLLKDMEHKNYELTKHEWNNFTRLRFHGLVAKTEDSGYWLLTKRGADFLNGRVEIPSYVWIKNNTVAEKSEEMINVAGVTAKPLYLEKIDDIVYRSFEPTQTNLL